MFLLCKGRVAKKPYIMPITGKRIYSLEELCYEIYHNIYSVTEEIFVPSLVDWLKNEVGEPVAAKKMEALIRRNNDLKDMVITLLCACDYYKEEEVMEVLEIMKQIADLPPHLKQKRKADNYLRAGHYGQSLACYKELMNGKESERYTPEEYGDLLHNQAIAYFYISSFSEAGRYFKEAYARNKREESLQYYLTIFLMQGKEEEFYTEGLRMKQEKETLDRWKKEFDDSYLSLKDIEVERSFADHCKRDLRVSYA